MALLALFKWDWLLGTNVKLESLGHLDKGSNCIVTKFHNKTLVTSIKFSGRAFGWKGVYIVKVAYALLALKVLVQIMNQANKLLSFAYMLNQLSREIQAQNIFSLLP